MSSLSMTSSRKYATPLAFTVNPSRIATLLYVAIAFLTCLLVLFLPLSAGWCVLLFILVVFWTVFILAAEWRYLAKFSVKKIEWKNDNEWSLEFTDNQRCEARLLGNSVSLPFLIILNFKLVEGWRSQSVSLYKDSIDADVFRRLRVRLKIQSTTITD